MLHTPLLITAHYHITWHQISRTTYVNFQTFVFLGYLISRNLNTASMMSELCHAHMCSSLVIGTLDGCCETSDIAKTTTRYTQTVKVWTAWRARGVMGDVIGRKVCHAQSYR